MQNDKKKGEKRKLTLGQYLSDKLTLAAGSWTFITSLIVLLIIWMILNTYLVLIFNWDPYPFILLNLVLSCLAALQAPVILMSQNRSAERDRAKAERDYYVNRLAEREIKTLRADILELKHKLLKLPIPAELAALKGEINELHAEINKLEKIEKSILKHS